MENILRSKASISGAFYYLKVYNMIKSMADKIAKKKAKNFMLKAAADKGFNLEDKMTSNIEDKLDALMQAIIDDVGYAEMAKMGLKL